MNSEFNPQPHDEEWQHEEATVSSEHVTDEATERLARLQASPEEEALPIRMRQVDLLLESTPMAAPRPGFADRVLAMLKERTPYILKPHAGLGLALGLSMSAGFAIFLVILALLLVAIIALNWSTVYKNVALAMSEISTAVGGVLDALGNLLGDATPFALFIVLLAIPLFFIWLWVLRGRTKKTTEG